MALTRYEIEQVWQASDTALWAFARAVGDVMSGEEWSADTLDQIAEFAEVHLGLRLRPPGERA